MRFLIQYKIGQSVRDDVIEASDLEAAEARANVLRPTWTDITYQVRRVINDKRIDTGTDQGAYQDQHELFGAQLFGAKTSVSEKKY